jgi:molybdopterin-guanine dinucleotide biosynthesis protein A
MEELTVVIQAGGESRRMGQSKATVSFCGRPLICRGLKRLGSIADELIVTSNDQASLDFLCSNVTFDKLKLYSDIFNRRSALNGLHTALYYATSPYVAVVACDMIFASAPLLAAERDALIESGADIAIPRTSHGYEPFHAVYRRETCLPLVLEALQAGETRATSWFDQVKLYEFTSEMSIAIDPRGGFFSNVNTPEELKDMETRVMGGSITFASDDLQC